MKTMKLFLLALALCASAVPAFSLDFGLLADQKLEAGESENVYVTYTPAFTPWFSWDSGGGLSVYLSAGVSLKAHYYDNDIDEDDGWRKPNPLFEVSRFALRYLFNQNVLLEAGRAAYSDVMGFSASGLFDGVRVRADLPWGSITGGAWYTGLLYKESAEILMTGPDIQNYAEPCDWDNPGAYFASRRVFASLRWDMPVLEYHNLSVEALAQFDLNGEDEALHSQQGEILLNLFPGKLALSAGALFEAMESKDGEFAAALGALFRLGTELPGSLDDSLTAQAKFTSGQWNDTFISYRPLCSPSQGEIFSGTLSGLAALSLDYTARLHKTLLGKSVIRYFIRAGDDPAASGKNLYGGELWASLAWQPLEDLRFSLGGGVFVPALGNIDTSGEASWKMNAGLTLSL